MKFGDKLVELRKKNGYSQEELAEKLGVSRQSVSKWESNNTYPETDKIVQIANIFDCSMDDLINDKISDVDSTLRKNKNNIKDVWSSLLEFITSSVSMFSRMSFMSGLKCVLEMVILGFILSLIGHIISGICSSILSNIFSFLSVDIIYTIEDVLYGIFILIWFVIAIIILIHTFKIRYLNYYSEETIDKVEKKHTDNVDITNCNKKDKIIVRDEKPFEFLSTLAKIVILFIKFITFWIILGAVSCTIGLVVITVLTIYNIPTHILFLWLTLLLIACIVVSIQIIIILIQFIFNKKICVVRHLIIFISCVLLFGISVGLLILSIKNIEFVSDNSAFNLKTQEITLDYKDNLVINENGIGINKKLKYVIDNSIDDDKIIISKLVDKKYFGLSTHESSMDKMPLVIVNQTANRNFNTYYDLFSKNLKNNKLVTFKEYGNDPLVIRANELTINKLLNNTKLLYLIKETRNDNEIDVILKDSKVHFKYGLKGEYNAIDDSIKYDDENYSCNKEIEKTEYGERIIYSCDYKETESIE